MEAIAFDLETYLFGPGNMCPMPVCLTWCDGHVDDILVGNNMVWWVEQMLKDEVVLVGHNVAYDFGCLYQHYPALRPLIWNAYEQKRVQCTFVREKLLDIAYGLKGDRRKYSLAAIVNRRFDVELDKETWRTGYEKFDGVPLGDWPRGAKEYALDDARYTYRVFEKQIEDAAGLNYEFFDEEAPRQASFAFSLHLTAAHGVLVDQEQVAKLEAEIQPKMEAARATMIEAGLVVDGKKVMENIRKLVENTYFGDEDGPPVTPTGKTSTAKKTLEKCSAVALQALVEFNALQKTNSTYVQKYKEAGSNPIHTRYDVLGGETGRTSSYNPNLQNQPRLPGIRECVIARPGYVFIFCDYDAQELRTLAQACYQLCGTSKLRDRFLEDPDFDPHTHFAAQLLHITYEEALERKRAGDEELLDYRQRAKCFHPDTEVLTRERGWVKIGELDYTDEVAAAYPGVSGSCSLAWEKPTALTRRKSPGELVHLKNENINLRVTEDHRMLGFIRNGNPRVVRPADMENVRRWSNAGMLTQEHTRHVPEGLLRLAVATQADGSYTGAGIRFGFTKPRKIERMRMLLKEFSGWSENTIKGDIVSFYVQKELASQVRALLDSDKTLPWWWLGFSSKCRLIVLDEAAHWDGSIIGSGRSYSYSSTIRKNVEVLQTLGAVSGRKTHLYPGRDRDNDPHAPCHHLRVSDRSYSRGGSLSCKKIPYDGDVVCLSVPSSFVLVRDGGIPVVVGQCANFGYPGGMGILRFIEYAQGYGLQLTEAEAKELRDHWFQQYPEMRVYFRHVAQLSDGGRALLQLMSGRLRGGVGFCDAANSYFQGLASDASKLALYEVTKKCFGYGEETYLLGSRPVLFVHDEIGIETPEEAGHEAALELQKTMVEAMEVVCPDVPARASPAMMRRWSKKAKPKFVEGRLVPWDD